MSCSEHETLNLFRGWPHPDLLPMAALAEASAAIMARPDVLKSAMRYGPEQGYAPLRQYIAEWLSSFYQPQDAVTASRICITGGASQGLVAILSAFTDPIYTRIVWMVAPTYFIAGEMMEDAGFNGRLRAVPEDESGVDLAFLRQELVAAEEKAEEAQNAQPYLKSQRPWGKIYKHLIYTVSTFSNPSTRTMTLSARQGLVRLAREFDALIVSDDVYDFLQWSADPTKPMPNEERDKAQVARLVDIDRFLDGGPKDGFGNAVSNGSFSKIVGPGLRTGWTEATPKWTYALSQIGAARSGGAPSHMCAVTVSQMLSKGAIQKHLNDVACPAYAVRYHHLMASIHEFLLPLGVTLPSPPSLVAGGYFIWVQLPEPLRAREIAPLALNEFRVSVGAGHLFQVQGDSARDDFDRGLRLSFAWEDEDKLDKAACRLAGAIRQALKSV